MSKYDNLLQTILFCIKCKYRYTCKYVRRYDHFNCLSRTCLVGELTDKVEKCEANGWEWRGHQRPGLHPLTSIRPAQSGTIKCRIHN